jgi:ribosome-associated toxin RatA of RatAB toxin-antitoxin module
MGSFGGSFTEEIDAPPERCFALASDMGGISAWQDPTEATTVLERHPDGRAALVEMRIDAQVSKVTVVMRFGYDEPAGLHWTRERGDLKRVDGSWRFEPIGSGRTRATYTLDIDPGRMLSMLAKGSVVDRLTRHLGEQPPRGLKRVAEGP